MLATLFPVLPNFHQYRNTGYCGGTSLGLPTFFLFFLFFVWGWGGGPQICKIVQYFPSGFMNRKACCVRKQPSSFFSTALPLFELFSDELCWYILTVTALISKDTSNNEISMETHIHTSGDRVCCVNIPSTHIFK